MIHCGIVQYQLSVSDRKHSDLVFGFPKDLQDLHVTIEFLTDGNMQSVDAYGTCH